MKRGRLLRYLVKRTEFWPEFECLVRIGGSKDLEPRVIAQNYDLDFLLMDGA